MHSKIASGKIETEEVVKRKIVSRIFALFIVFPCTYIFFENIVGWEHPLWTWYFPLSVVSFFLTFLVDIIVEKNA